MCIIIILQLTFDKKSGRKKNSGINSFTSELVPLKILAAVAGNDINCLSATSNLQYYHTTDGHMTYDI